MFIAVLVGKGFTYNIIYIYVRLQELINDKWFILYAFTSYTQFRAPEPNSG